MKEPFIICPLGTFKSIGEGIGIKYSLMLPNQLAGLEMPPEVWIHYFLSGKDGTEREEKKEQKYIDLFFYITHDSTPCSKVVPPDLK
jgi:hypothetical protein